VVIRLGRGFAVIAAAGARLVCGAGALDINVALAARDSALAGLEFLSGIPGTIGGALRMNAGAYGTEMKDVLIAARVLDGQGGRHTLGPQDIGFGYRYAGVPDDWIFTEAILQGQIGDAGLVAKRMEEIRRARETSQPIRARTGGSTFANPPGEDSGGLTAWQLIERAGCRGLRRGGAQVSELHCNFLINTGDATAADLEGLGEEVRRRVRDTSGVDLRWEIRRVGVPLAEAGQ
jgi:UDP-N-acetylmuramate dehydrogenase